MHLGRGMGRRASVTLAVLGLGTACAAGKDDTTAGGSGADGSNSDGSGADGTGTDEDEPSCLDYNDLGLPGYLIVGEWGGVGVSSVSMAGDMNGDGFADVVTLDWDFLDWENAVARFSVSFGKADGEPIDLADVAQNRGGFTVSGLGSDFGCDTCFPYSEAAGLGDFNGDGFGDLALVSGGISVPTAAYIVFGSESPTHLDVEDLEAGQGGARIGEEAEDLCTSVAGPGDLNGDGLGELMVSTWGQDLDEPQRTYVIFGTEGPPPALADVVAGTGGFVIEGASGEVDGAGDVNGDGVPDVMVGDPDGITVVFGKADTETVYADDVRAGEGGFFIEPYYAEGFYSIFIGAESPAGDINGDGLDDLLVDLYQYAAESTWPYGSGYVVFGKEDTEAVSLHDVEAGDGGFLVDWPEGEPISSGVGDQNGDGFGDIATTASGELLVMFGKTDTAPSRLPDVRVTEMFFGDVVAGGEDINGDGFLDFVIAAYPSCAVVVLGGDTWDE